MLVTVSSRHTEISDALRAVAVEKIGRLDRFLEGLDHAQVHFNAHHNPRIAEKEVCEVTLEGQGHHIRCKVAASDGFAAVDMAIEKLEVQLHRLKTRLKNKASQAGRHVAPPRPPSVDVSAPEVDDEDRSMADDSYIIRSGEAVLRRKSFAERPMKVDDAVAQLELLDHDFFLFTNVETGNCTVLYRRHSGGLGLIEQVPVS